MPVLHIPVGIPGCGKSSFGTLVGADIIVSSDAIREATGDVYDQTKNAQVFKQFHREIERGLMNAHSVFADATSLNRFARFNLKQIVDRVNVFANQAGHAGHHAHGYPFPVTTHVILFRNLEQAIRRNSQRERVVPGDAMLHMIEKYEQTITEIYDEGWDHITEITKVS